MAISLQKGQKIDLTKTNPGLKNVIVGLGWDVNKYDGGSDFDLDTSAFLVDASGKAPSDSSFIFYGNLKSECGSVQHMGDNLTGAGDGDDEQIKVDLSKVPANIEKIAFTVTIYDYETRQQNFGQVSNAYIRLAKRSDEFDEEGETLLKFDLEEEFSIETALVVAELYQKNGEWKFNAVAAGYQGGLEAIVRSFGGNV